MVEAWVSFREVTEGVDICDTCGIERFEAVNGKRTVADEVQAGRIHGFHPREWNAVDEEEGVDVVGGEVGYVTSVEGGAVDNEGFSVIEGAPLYLGVLGLNPIKVRGVSARQYCFAQSILEASPVCGCQGAAFHHYHHPHGECSV
jgi:hypothetical protein